MRLFKRKEAGSSPDRPGRISRPRKAALISVAVTFLLFLAGVRFVSSRVQKMTESLRQQQLSSATAENDNNALSEEAVLSQWLGLDSIRQIISPESDAPASPALSADQQHTPGREPSPAGAADSPAKAANAGSPAAAGTESTKDSSASNARAEESGDSTASGTVTSDKSASDNTASSTETAAAGKSAAGTAAAGTAAAGESTSASARARVSAGSSSSAASSQAAAAGKSGKSSSKDKSAKADSSKENSSGDKSAKAAASKENPSGDSSDKEDKKDGKKDSRLKDKKDKEDRDSDKKDSDEKDRGDKDSDKKDSDEKDRDDKGSDKKDSDEKDRDDKDSDKKDSDEKDRDDKDSDRKDSDEKDRGDKDSDKEDPDEKDDDDDDGDELTKTQKNYVRQWEENHQRSFPLNTDLHEYNWDHLEYDDEGVLHYRGDENYKIRRGIDVSEFQGQIDWETVKAAGYDFAFIRAGHRTFHTGDLQEDTRAVKNLKRAEDAGLDVGVYVFSQAVSEEEAIEEAELCLRIIDESGVEISLPIVYDPEIQLEYDARINYVSDEQFTDNAVAFCKVIKKAGYDPAIYANCSTETDILDMSRLEDAEIWYADYNSIPESPYRFTFWQYSNTGWVDGIPEAETDLNVWFVEK